MDLLSRMSGWHENLQRMNKRVSLIVSPLGERVAVLIWNQLTIFHSNDNYRKPCGVYKREASEFFTHGMWSEKRDILCILDGSGTFILIHENGEEFLKIERKTLNFSSPIIYFLFDNNADINDSCLCTLDILTSDSLLRYVEINGNTKFYQSSTHSQRPCMDGITFPNSVFCVDYSPGSSLLALVGNIMGTSWIPKLNKGIIFGPRFGYSGACHLSIWRFSRNSYLQPLFSVDVDGVFVKPRGYMGPVAHPKVMFSPGGLFVSTLDMEGTLNIYNLNEDGLSLSRSVRAGSESTKKATAIPNSAFQSSDVITDFVWFSDQVISFASSVRGILTVIDVISGLQLCKNDTMYSKPLLEGAKKSKRLFFLLETTTFSDLSSSNTSNFVEMRDSSHCLRLVPFSEGYVTEMYSFLIEGKQFEDALRFADTHGLETDEIFKSQWLCSEKKECEINSFLFNMKDKDFALGQCVIHVASDEASMRALLTHGLFLTEHYRFLLSDGKLDDQNWGCCLQRLKLLQFQDRLETFMGINMGRYSAKEYAKFRSIPIEEAAISLAETGKIGALNLLFKRHSYSLIPNMLKVLATVPETLPVDAYSQILPGRLPPKVFLREKDWVESEEMVTFMSDPSLSSNIDIISSRTESIVRNFSESTWPSSQELCLWYKNRALDIDIRSGCLDNSLLLINYAFRKDLSELQEFRDDISYLHELVYSADGGQEAVLLMSLSSWEKLPDYEKFKMMLTGVEGETLVQRLHKNAVPFMKSRFSYGAPAPENNLGSEYLTVEDDKTRSFLVRWLKDIASDNRLDLCFIVINEGCGSSFSGGFKDWSEAASSALECIYLCEALDKWDIMEEVLSKVQQTQDDGLSLGDLLKKLKLTAGYIEAGRILSFYQVSKPLYYFLEAGSDEKGVKQIIRLMLSKFIRRKHCSDNDWADMWRDMQFLYDVAFPFLGLDYMFVEFFRGLLKAGRFSLAGNYLNDMVHLTLDKAETIVIQTSREYLFSASSLSSPEIWKAMECLQLLPKRGKVKSEMDMIEALTVKLPGLGVTLLPVQLKEMKDPMMIVKTVMASQPSSSSVHLHFEHILAIAKQLGLLNSPHDISSIEEAVAREAAIAGDLQLALTLCLVLAKKGNGSIWDLCAAIARGPPLDSMDSATRRTLLGFSLGHCDGESIGELLQVWKDMDLQCQCERLAPLPAEEEEDGRLLEHLHDALVGSKDAFFTNVRFLLSLVSAREGPSPGFPVPETVASALKFVSFPLAAENFPGKLTTLGSDTLSLMNMSEFRHKDALIELPEETTAAVPAYPGLEISPDEPLTVGSATSCFIRLCDSPGAESRLDDLASVLDRWGCRFREKGEASPPEMEMTMISETALPLHPLHTCWVVLFNKLVVLGRFDGLTKLVGKSGSCPETVLLGEDEAMALVLAILEADCFAAMKVALLLPYREVQQRCVTAVEQVLEGGVPEGVKGDGELLLVLLFSGIVGTMMRGSGFEGLFSCLCHLIGFFCGRVEEKGVRGGTLVVFRRVVFPCFVARLVAGGRVLAAGSVLAKAAGWDGYMAGLDFTSVGLRRYLQNQLDDGGKWVFDESLVSPLSYSFVRDSFCCVVKEALLLLSF